MNITIQKSHPLRVCSIILATVAVLSLVLAIATLVSRDSPAVHNYAIVGLVMSLVALPLATLSFITGYGFTRLDGDTLSEHRGKKELWKINVSDVTSISMAPLLSPFASARAKRLYRAMEGDRRLSKKRTEIEHATGRVNVPSSISLILRDGRVVRLTGEEYTFADRLRLEPILSNLLSRKDITLDSAAAVHKIISTHWFRIDPVTQRPVSAAPVTLLGKISYHAFDFKTGLVAIALLLLIYPAAMLHAWLA